MIGANFVIRATYLTTACSRAAIFIGTKKAFEIFKNFERTDKKVRRCLRCSKEP
jgi:hypothetical protein